MSLKGLNYIQQGSFLLQLCAATCSHLKLIDGQQLLILNNFLSCLCQNTSLTQVETTIWRFSWGDKCSYSVWSFVEISHVQVSVSKIYRLIILCLFDLNHFCSKYKYNKIESITFASYYWLRGKILSNSYFCYRFHTNFT